jgi:hypothetical protein
MYALMVLVPGLLISGAASLMVRLAFNKYSQVRTQRGLTGAEAARVLLDRVNIRDVRIVRSHGFLSDHYNPLTKELALSEATHDSPSVAAVGVACHEAGHAIQHAHNYFPLWARSALVPLAGIGSNLGYIVMAIGLAISNYVVLAGAALFACVLLFQIVTLPVEFNASSRAKQLVLEAGIVTRDERVGIDRVLNAAALTYVAAVISTLLTLLYYLWRAGLLGGAQDE